MNKNIVLHSLRLSQIKLLSLDVDGVLTDGGIYYSDKGDSYRKFNAKDGVGISQILDAGVQVCIISAGDTGAIQARAKRLNINHVYTNVHDKLSILAKLAKKLNLKMSQIAHVGDDLNDLDVFKEVGLSITVNDAVAPVLSAAQVITQHKGGDGAVREICDSILKCVKNRNAE